MIRAKHSMVGLLRSSAAVGAWAGGIYGLLVASWYPWALGAGTTPAVSGAFQTFILACLGGVATGAVTGAIVGGLMGVGIYDFLKHEQDAREVDRMFTRAADENTMRRRQVALPWQAKDFGVNRQPAERSRRAFEGDR